VGPESDHLAEAQQDAQLAPQEIASVVAMYELGHLESVRPFAAGSSRAPKAKVVTDSGAFLLKRLAPSRTNLDRLRFQHQVIQHLSEAGFPVAEVQRSRLNQTIAERGSHYYELSRWIDGHRYHYCPKEAKASGSAMAAMHDLLSPLKKDAPRRRGYHDRRDVAQALVAMAEEYPGDSYERIADLLRVARRSVRPHWATLPMAVVHGDWHPGNLLMGTDRVAAVIDLESACLEPRVSDLANGLLQFSLNRIAGSPVASWPVASDLTLLGSLLAGYQLVAREPLKQVELDCIPSLMIEAMAVESTIALRRKGRLRSMTPEMVMPWIFARLDWIDQHREEIIESSRRC
jgi:Ser/Thr protein kinase RdoA (MazF antagonist)